VGERDALGGELERARFGGPVERHDRSATARIELSTSLSRFAIPKERRMYVGR